MYSKRLIILILSFILIGTITSGKPDWAIGKEDIVIGIITPMSGPGADLGISARYGAEEGVAEVNSAGGLLGMRLKLIYRDDESNPQKGVSTATEFVSGRKVDVIMGGMSTPVAMAISPIINGSKMIFMTFGTGTPLIDVTKYPYNFRIKYYTNQEAKVIVNHAVKRKGFKKIGILTDTSAYGKTGRDDLLKELEAAGIKPIGIDQYNWGDTDMTGQLLKLRQAGAEVLLLWGMGQDVAQIARSAQKLSWDIPAIGGSGICQLGFGRLAGEAARDWGGSIFKRVTFTDNEPISKELLTFLDKLDQKYGKERKCVLSDILLWVDTVRIYANAVKQAGSVDSEKVKAALENTKNFKGFLSTYSFSPNNHDGMRLQDLTVAIAASLQRESFYRRAPDAP